MRILILLILVDLCGCAHVADRYSVSADSVALIRGLAPRSINVGRFSTGEGVPLNAAPCAGVTIAPSDEGTFSEYIRAALIAELKMAGAYSDRSAQTITATLDALSVDASAFSATGEWSIRMTLIGVGKPFTVSENYRFKSQNISSTTCDIASRRFAPAIQNLVEKIVSTPEFAGLAKE